jgi:hypothetical protein
MASPEVVLKTLGKRIDAHFNTRRMRESPSTGSSGKTVAKEPSAQWVREGIGYRFARYDRATREWFRARGRMDQTADFLVYDTGADRAWAERVGWQLE